jgi:hypothetical protein
MSNARPAGDDDPEVRREGAGEPTAPGVEAGADGGHGTWTEPVVASKAIFTELFRSGARSEQDMERLLGAHATNMGWVDYWSREGFLTTVVGSGGRSFEISPRAVLELELN